MEGDDDFTTRASKRMAYVQQTNEQFSQGQDFGQKFSPPRKKDYHTMMKKKLTDGSPGPLDSELVPPKGQARSHTRSRSYSSSSISNFSSHKASSSSKINPCHGGVDCASDKSMLLMSSYGESASEGACEIINDSRFNDISCISYGTLDRTTMLMNLEDKDTISRIDVSKLSMSGETTTNCGGAQASNSALQSSSANKTTDSSGMMNSSSSSASRRAWIKTLTARKSSASSKHRRSNSNRRNNDNNNNNRGDDSLHASNNNCTDFADNKSSMSAKRLRRDSARAATDGIKKTNPLPLAIPILRQRDLPPDRLCNTSSGSLLSSASAATGGCTPTAAVSLLAAHNATANNRSMERGELASHNQEATSSLQTAHPAAAETTNTTSGLPPDKRLASLLRLGHNCASLLGAICVSTQLSKSYNEESLRFTCTNGHNFFLSVHKVQHAMETL